MLLIEKRWLSKAVGVFRRVTKKTLVEILQLYFGLPTFWGSYFNLNLSA
jgi:hypothetical protein